MKHKFLILAFLITGFLFGQNPKVKFQQWKEVTTTERDAFTPLANTFPQIYNTTTDQFEYWNGTAWVAIGGSGTTPTLQEVLTEGNVIENGTSIVLDDSIGNPKYNIGGYLLGGTFLNVIGLNYQENPITYSTFNLGEDGMTPTISRSDPVNGSFNGLVMLQNQTNLLGSGVNHKGLVGIFDYSANYANDDNAYGQVGFINGLVTSASITGTQNIDWDSRFTVRNYTLTGATTFTESNLKPRVIEFLVTGDFALTLPSTWTAFPNNDAYDGTGDNHLVVTCIVDTSGSEKIFYTLTNI